MNSLSLYRRVYLGWTTRHHRQSRGYRCLLAQPSSSLSLTLSSSSSSLSSRPLSSVLTGSLPLPYLYRVNLSQNSTYTITLGAPAFLLLVFHRIRFCRGVSRHCPIDKRVRTRDRKQKYGSARSIAFWTDGRDEANRHALSCHRKIVKKSRIKRKEKTKNKKRKKNKNKKENAKL